MGNSHNKNPPEVKTLSQSLFETKFTLDAADLFLEY